MTLEGELLAAFGGLAIFISTLAVGFRTYAPAGNRGVLIPPALILGGVLVTLLSPLPAVGRIELARIVSSSLLLAAFLLLRPPDSARLLFLFAALFLGSVLVLYGILDRGGIALSGAPLTATYVNRNHIAAFLGLILPPALGFSLGSKPRGAAWLSRAALPILLGGILLTRSRGGIAAASAAAAAVGLIYVLNRRTDRAAGRRRVALFISAVLIVLGAVVLYAWFRLPDSSPIPAPHPEVLSIRTRLSIWRSTWDIFLARPAAGWGWGTFRYIYPAFKEAGVWYTVPHAHNEVLQFLAEGGLIGFSLAAFSLVLAWRGLLKRHKDFPESLSGLLALGAAGSLVYAAVHSGFDFILRLPANALFLAALVGFGLSGGSEGRKSSGLTGRRPVPQLVGLTIAGALIIFLFLPLFRFYRSEVTAREGELLMASGRPAEAWEIFSRAHRLDPSSSRPLLGRAAAGMAVFDRSKDKIGLYASIIEDLKTARRNNPGDTRPLRQLSRFHQRLSAFGEADKCLKDALVLDPLNPYLHYELAENDIHRGDYLSAARRLRRANEIYPMMWDGSRKLLFNRTGDYEILKELPPREGRYHRLMGYYLLQDDNEVGAEEEFSRAVEASPEEPENWRALGMYYSRAGKPEKALPFYRQALARSPARHQWLAELGDILHRLGRQEEARDCFLQAGDLDPGRRSYWEKAGSIIFTLDGPAAAIAFWGEVAARNQEWSRPYYLRARYLLETSQPAEAEREIDQALARTPGNRQYLKLKALIGDILLREDSR